MSRRNRQPSNHPLLLGLAAVAGFCRYAFCKPFTAGTCEDLPAFGVGLKSALMTSLLLRYVLFKLIGIEVGTELRGNYRAIAIVGLIGMAEAALVGFAYVPIR